MSAEATPREAGPKPHPVTVTVNRRPVDVPDHKVTGLQLKQAAVDAGVIPDVGFQISKEEANGDLEHIRDDQEIVINKHSRFLAVAPDDNS